MAYNWVKVLHVVAIISWMAGMLYLPRLFVYHAVQEPGSGASEMLKVMERRLLRFIMNPAMVVAWLTGLWLAYSASFWSQGWLHGKLLFVLALSGVHGFLGAEVKRLATDQRGRDQKFYRIVNEIPTVLMVGIVIFVIVKPFA
jgi:putative membrane protein